ncbi:IclR family transcriptional regulator [Latilactobacillus sakei]|uniref:IclR family transcriptional regulator n=1 Tax=Latilactobacillus sakei TaxID=1599 RepID=A0AAF0GPW6_LATSK|nr:IclR family transcriptional regulator [Latilactobacillus sakei]WGI19964.1 IclR family transcriptional regulator [Latilactobacillus sakei]
MPNQLYGGVLLKVKAIMDLLSEKNDGLTLKEICEGVDISKSTTLKILTTLQHIGFVRRLEEEKKYYLGTDLISYGQNALSGFDITDVAGIYLKELRNVTGETVNLGIESNDKIILLQKFESLQSIKLNSKVGSKLDLYSSAMGKAMLSTMSDEMIADYFSREQLIQLTEQTIINPQILMKQVKEVQQNGFAIDYKESQDEVVCVGANLEKYNHVFGVFSVSIPEYRLDSELLEDIRRLVLTTKQQIEAVL